VSTAHPLAFAVNHLLDIHDVEARNENETVAFSEMREVLRKYGLEKKYGITLLHKHFDLAEDEVLVEYTDIENRTLTSMPIKVGTIPSNVLIETTWTLDQDIAMGNCITVCYYDAQRNGHVGKHSAAGA
jgi:hypothetical protein